MKKLAQAPELAPGLPFISYPEFQSLHFRNGKMGTLVEKLQGQSKDSMQGN